MNEIKNNIKVELKDVYKSYDGSQILKGISIIVYDEEFISIIGPSGCGKSTIFNLITNITAPDSGIIKVNGKISYMYQKDLLLPYSKIIDNVSLPLKLKSMPTKKAREEVKSYFKTFGLEGYENKYPDELSGGMRQRANFLRTYIASNDIMLLDEPFGALDSITKISLQKWFLDIKKKVNVTILMITHDIDEAIRLSDRIYVLSDKPARILKEIELKELKKNGIDIVEIDKIKQDITRLLEV